MNNTADNRARVTTSRHITVENPPKNWRELSEFADWRAGHPVSYLCGFVEIEREDGNTYLTSTVY